MTIDDIPLYNWMKCTDGDIQFVRKDLADGTQEDDLKYWNAMFDDYLQRYGLSDLYKRMLKVMKDKAILETEFVLTKDRFKLTLIEIESNKLEAMMSNSGEGMTIDESLVHLSKWLGYHLNVKRVTAGEYFTILKQYGKEGTKK